MIEQAKAVAQRLREGWTDDTLEEGADTIDALVQENLRLAGEVSNRNRRALEGDKATKALDKAHDYYESKLSELRAEVERLSVSAKSNAEAAVEAEAEVERLNQEYGHLSLRLEAVKQLSIPVPTMHQPQWGNTPAPKQEQAEPVATLWREKNQKLYPGPSWKLTPAGEALPLGVEHHLYTAPKGQTALLKQALEALSDIRYVSDYTHIVALCESIKQHLGEA